MAEDAVDQAMAIADFPHRSSTTSGLKILPADTRTDAAGEQLHPDLPYFVGDVIRAFRDEMAHTVEDVLARRTRALFLNARAAVEIAPKVAEIMAEELGMDAGWIKRQIESFGQVAAIYSIGDRDEKQPIL